FTVPSEILTTDFPPDSYTIRLKLEPNYLRSGRYSLALKLFSDGRRLDTLTEALTFSVNTYVSPDQESSTFSQWNAGVVWLPYRWSGLESTIPGETQLTRR